MSENINGRKIVVSRAHEKSVRASIMTNVYARRCKKFAVWAIAFVFLAVALFHIAPQAIADSSETSYVSYVVQPGDSLWSFAQRITEPGQDVNDSIDVLMQVNNLESVELRVGQTIQVPYTK